MSTQTQDAKYEVNIFLFTAQIIGVVILTKLTSFLDVLNLYFSFQSLFFGTQSTIAPLAVLIKLLIPLLSSFVILSTAAALLSSLGPAKLESLRNSQTKLAMQAGGFASVVLLTWPMIVHWDALANEAISDKRTAFLSIYGLYAISFFYLSGIGAALARRFSTPSEASASREPADWRKIVVEAAFGTVAAGFATFVLGELGLT